LPPPATPEARPPPCPGGASAAADAAAALLQSGLADLARLEAGGAAALCAARRASLLKALSGRRTRHGAAGVLPWVKRRRRHIM
jgi:hypothetical protein